MLIQCDGFNKNLLFLILMGISYFIKVFSVSIQKKIDKKVEPFDFKYHEHPLYYILLMFIGEALIGVLYLIENAKSGKDYKIKYQNIKLSERMKIAFLPFVACLLDGCLSLLSSVLINYDHLSLELLNKLLMIFLNTLMTRFVFKKLFYKHHFLGIIVISVATIGITVIQMISTSSLLITSDRWYFILLAIFISILCCIQDSLEKYAMTKGYYFPLRLIALEGVYGTILIIALTGILSLVKSDTSIFCSPNEETSCEDITMIFKLFVITKGRLFASLGMIVSFFCFNTLRMKIIYNLSTAHRSLSDTFGGFLIWFFLLNIFGDEKLVIPSFILGISSYVIIIIGVLIFMEIIVLGCCGLDKDISNEIQIRDSENLSGLIKELDSSAILEIQKIVDEKNTLFEINSDI